MGIKLAGKSAFVALLMGLVGVQALGEKRVRLSDVDALTLRAGQQTQGRRSTVPQLQCVSGPCQETPSVVQCRNVGSNGLDVQWKCEAEFADGRVSFDQSSLVVSCEGFDYPDDPWVTAGSCGLRYGLVDHRPASSTDHARGAAYSNEFGGWSRSHGDGGSGGIGIVGWVLILSVLGFLYFSFTAPSEGPPRAYGGPGVSSGGYFGRYGGYGGYSPAGSGGGFWSGLGLGGLAGYMAARPSYGYGYGSPYGYGYRRGSGWGWGGGGGGGYRRSSGGASSGPRTGSGFASTTRR